MENNDLKIKYSEFKEKYKKTVFCYLFWRQRCFFSKERCKLAHGIDDLKRVSLSDLRITKENFYKSKALIHNLSIDKWTELDKSQAKITDLMFSSDEEEVKTLNVKRKQRTKEERLKIKEQQNNIIKDFFEQILKEYNGKLLRKKTLDHEFKNAKIPFSFDDLTKLKLAFTKCIPVPPCLIRREHLVFKINSLKELQFDNIQEVKRILINCPIEEKVFPLNFDKFCEIFALQSNINFPSIKQLMKLLEISIDEYINIINENQELKTELKIMNNQSIIFNNYSLSGIDLIIKEYIKEKQFPILIDCHNLGKLFKFKKNEFNEIIIDLLYKNNYQVIQLVKEKIIFKINSLPTFPDIPNFEKYIKILKNLSIENKEYEGLILKKVKFNEYHLKFPIFIISNKEELIEAYEFLKSDSILGVDLEGNLSHNGKIDLIQISKNGNIFIFDFLFLRQTQDLFDLMKSLLSKIFLNDTNISVFFDCRRDTEALYGQLLINPENVIDLQPAYYFIYKLVLNSEDKKMFKPMPSLNEALKLFKANHGINIFKDDMKEVFSISQQAFCIRPISSEFLEYAAWDVADLHQCAYNAFLLLSNIYSENYSYFLLNLSSQKNKYFNCIASNEEIKENVSKSNDLS